MDGFPDPETNVWVQDARCRGMDPMKFFPSTSRGVLIAQRECAACPVRQPCLEYALDNHIKFGVWGGMSERSRRVLQRRRRKQRATQDAPAPDNQPGTRAASFV